MILVIDATENGKISLTLFNGQAAAKKEIALKKYKDSEKALFYIDRFLSSRGVLPKDLKAVAAVTGKGSFTALRIAAGIANAFAFILKIPAVSVMSGSFKDEDGLYKEVMKKIKNYKKRDIVSPVYGRDPNIIISK